MKAICLFLVLFLSLLTSGIYAQAPDWSWTKSVGGNRYDFASKVVTDGNNNVYVGGYFGSDSVVFGTNVLKGSHVSSSSYNIFLVKYDASGNVIWTRSAGGTGYDYLNAMCTDGNGNVYIAGTFSKVNKGANLYEDSLVFDTIVLTNQGSISVSTDIFIAKYDAAGNVLWARNIPGTNDNHLNSICADQNGNIYLAGSFDSYTLTVGGTTLTNIGTENIFIAKYDASGNPIWAKSAGGKGAEDTKGISADRHGNIYVTGYFLSDTIVWGSDTLVNKGFADIFIAKYDTSGHVIWAQSGNGSGDDFSTGICTDMNGNIYLTGYFNSPLLTFGSSSLTDTSTVWNSVFITKFNEQGHVIWKKNTGGAGQSHAYAVSTDNNDNVCMTGGFGSHTITFDSEILTSQGTGYDYIFVAKYDSSGNIRWAKSAGGNGPSDPLGIATDGDGSVFIVGGFLGPELEFGGDTLLNKTPANPDVFVAKIYSNPSGIEEMHEGNGKIKVYPNPSTSVFYFTGVKGGDVIDIYDVMGQRVEPSQTSRNGELNNQATYTANLSGKAKGVYFYRITGQGNLIQQGKMVVE